MTTIRVVIDWRFIDIFSLIHSFQQFNICLFAHAMTLPWETSAAQSVAYGRLRPKTRTQQNITAKSAIFQGGSSMSSMFLLFPLKKRMCSFFFWFHHDFFSRMFILSPYILTFKICLIPFAHTTLSTSLSTISRSRRPPELGGVRQRIHRCSSMSMQWQCIGRCPDTWELGDNKPGCFRKL